MGSEHPDWLPVDWKVSVKTRNFRRKDKCYINPANGLMFNSKAEVLQYIKISRETSNPKIGIKNTVAEKLPPGWIKEIRTKNNKGKIRRDPYYYDPVSGRQFRSMQEVFRYLESNDSAKAESRPDDKGHTSTELVDNSHSSSAESDGQRLIDERGDENMTDRESVKSGRDDAAPKNVENPVVEERLGEKLTQALNGDERRNGGRRLCKRLAGNKPKDDGKDHQSESGLETGGEKKMNIVEGGLEQREKENSCNENNTKRKWMESSTSKRVGGLESMEVKDRGEGEVDSSKIEDNPTVEKQKEPPSQEHENEDEKKQHMESCLKDMILMDPCIEFAIKTLTASAIPPPPPPIEEDVRMKKKSDNSPVSSSVSGDIWSDPCFDFAVKTLTATVSTEDGFLGTRLTF